MKKYFAAGFVISAVSIPATSLAHISHREAVNYGMSYAHASKVFGKRAAGCKLIGPNSTCHGKITDSKIRHSIDVLHRLFAPVPKPVAHIATSYTPTTTHTTTSSTSSSSYSSGGAGGVPACASESGTNYSTGPSNTNASSGATGRYQITPGTAAAHHCDLSTPAGQDSCAAIIYKTQGAGAWVGCGG